MQLRRRLLGRIRHDLKYGLIAETFLRQLIRVGLEISFYYVFKEGLSETKSQKVKSKTEHGEITFLGIDDMRHIACIDDRRDSESDFRERIARGDHCLALKVDGMIAGFTWCRFDLFAYPPNLGFKLKGNEAYLYDMYILKAYRGSDLAPSLRYRCYEELQKMGRDVLFSFSDKFNTPAIRFKGKLGARITSLCLYVNFGKRYQWNWNLRNYHINQKGV